MKGPGESTPTYATGVRQANKPLQPTGPAIAASGSSQVTQAGPAAERGR